MVGRAAGSVLGGAGSPSGSPQDSPSRSTRLAKLLRAMTSRSASVSTSVSAHALAHASRARRHSLPPSARVRAQSCEADAVSRMQHGVALRRLHPVAMPLRAGAVNVATAVAALAHAAHKTAQSRA